MPAGSTLLQRRPGCAKRVIMVVFKRSLLEPLRASGPAGFTRVRGGVQSEAGGGRRLVREEKREGGKDLRIVDLGARENQG